MTTPSPTTLSYVRLRRLIGVTGILLPFLCVGGAALFAGTGMQPSVSDYYQTSMRDLLVGLLVCVGALLATYRGYGLVDDVVTSLSGILAVGIAVFPFDYRTIHPPSHLPVGIFQLEAATSDRCHMVCAVGFFLLLAFNSLFLFTRTGPDTAPTPAKRRRNLVYRICGIAMFATLALLGIALLALPFPEVNRLCLILYGEVVLLGAFGISWLVKGETLLCDS